MRYLKVDLAMFFGKSSKPSQSPARWVAPTLGFFGVFASLAAIAELVTGEATTYWSRRAPLQVVTPHSDPGRFYFTVGSTVFWSVFLLYLARRQWRLRRDMLAQPDDKRQELDE